MPSPLPLAPPVMVIHETPLAAVHAQPAGVVTRTLAAPPPLGNGALVGAIAKVHAAPLWVTVNVLPAIVIVPVRGEDEGLEVTE